MLLYEGEELIGAKQNRVLERSILVAAGSKLEIPAKCVEQGRWAYRSRRFAPAPRAAYPELRRLRHDLGAPSQQAVWGEVAAKSARLGVRSATGAAEQMYVDRARARSTSTSRRSRASTARRARSSASPASSSASTTSAAPTSSPAST